LQEIGAETLKAGGTSKSAKRTYRNPQAIRRKCVRSAQLMRRRGVADLGQAAALQYQNPTLMENWIERAKR